MKIIAVIVASALVTWVALIAVLAIWRPKGMPWQAAKALIPDLLRLLRGLATDPATSRRVRVQLGVLLIYLASPIDLVPDFIPVLGYADDVIAVSLVLRSVVRHAGVPALNRHWSGTPQGFDLVCRLAGAGRPKAPEVDER